jgi:integrase
LLSSPICEERCLAVLKAIRSRNDKGVRLFSLRADGKRRRKSAGFRTSGGGKNYLTLLVAICNHAIRFMDVRTVPRLTGKVDFGEIAAREEHWTLEQRDAALAYLADHRDAEGRITLAHLFAFICIFTGSRKSAVTCLHWEKPTDGTRAPYVRFNHTTHEVLFDFGGWYAPSRKAKKKGGAKWCGGDRDARKRLIYDFMLLAWQQRRDGDAGRYVFGTWADKDHENKAPETAFRKVVESADFQAKVGKLPSNPHVLRHTYLTLGREAGVSCERLTEDTGANFKTILDNYAHLPRRESAREEDLAPQRSAVWGSSATDNIAVLPKREG